MDAPAPLVSIVIPAYDAASFVAERVGYLVRSLDESEADFEVVLVDDGSTDETTSIVAAMADSDPRLRLVRLSQNRGKFRALKEGIRASRGRACVFTDADVPYDPRLVPVFARLVVEQGFHLAVGDRTLQGSRYEADLTWVRSAASSAFRHFVSIVVTREAYDTQCGIKAFRGDVARALFPLLQEEGFAGDVELFCVARYHNLAIRRVPVRLAHQGPSSVRPLRDGIGMAMRVLALRRRLERGVYESDALRRMGSEDLRRA
jgi:glycosyltransferase involved in cell wall biosynthesis